MQELSNALAALATDLSDEQLSELEQALPPEAVVGTRYGEAQMAHLDSER